MLSRCFKKMQDYATMPLRVALGAVFIVHGIMKISTLAGTAAFLGSLGFPVPSVLAVILMLVELLGGAFLLFGFMTRYAALLISIEMIIAILVAKIGIGFIAMKGTGYEYDITLLAASISLLFTGAGKLSVDKALGWDC